jgi:putative protease
MQRPELLAPAGSWEALVAAVQNGADAVYFGGKAFNARYSATNFDDEQLVQAVEYCHVRGVKVYVTVNIILADQELKEALEFLHFLHNAGVDAIITQDLGLAKLARQVIPELPLHASTQMTVHNTAGVKLLQEYGFERIVLSREMQLEDIAQLKRETGADLETFMHGALCVCYSGQCLMSSMIGGRSGNRGRCAQPCRMQYQLVNQWGQSLVDNGKVGEYLLSPRDLNLSQYVPDLIKAGINSFKVEGRMKRPEYVATVINVYRQLIDKALAENEFSVDPKQARDLEQIFNRDFSTGFFYGNPGSELMSYKRPNNRGVLLGRVKKFSKDSNLVELSLQEPLQVGDGIEVWVTQGGRVGTEVSRIIVKGQQVESAPAGVSVWVDIRGKVCPGDRVFKTHDAELMQRAKLSYTSSKELRKIPLKFTVKASVGEPLHIGVVDPMGNHAEGSSAEVGQQAEKRPLTKEFLSEQLNRLGNTPFALGQLDCEINGQVMFPMRVINELRRTVLEDLEHRRSAKGARNTIDKKVFKQRLTEALASLDQPNQSRRNKAKLAVNVAELTTLKAVVDAGADIVYYGGESFRSRKAITVEDIKTAVAYCQKRGVDFILSSPRVMQDEELKRYLNTVEKCATDISKVLVGNLGLLHQLKTSSDLKMIADFSFSVFNQAAADMLSEQSVIRVTLSPELTMAQVREFAAHATIPLEALVHGALPLMVTEYCAMGSLMGGLTSKTKCSGPCRSQTCGLKDRKGVVFPIEVDQYCHQHIFNSKELCLIEDVGTLVAAGISVLRIDARIVNSERARKIVEAYRRVLGFYPDQEWQQLATIAKEELEAGSMGFTKGHYYRGII